MSRNRLHRSVEVDGKVVDYAINRRGCKGRWTKEDDEAMRQLVAAAVRQQQRTHASKRVPLTAGHRSEGAE